MHIYHYSVVTVLQERKSHQEQKQYLSLPGSSNILGATPS